MPLEQPQKTDVPVDYLGDWSTTSSKRWEYLGGVVVTRPTQVGHWEPLRGFGLGGTTMPLASPVIYPTPDDDFGSSIAWGIICGLVVIAIIALLAPHGPPPFAPWSTGGGI